MRGRQSPERAFLCRATLCDLLNRHRFELLCYLAGQGFKHARTAALFFARLIISVKVIKRSHERFLSDLGRNLIQNLIFEFLVLGCLSELRKLLVLCQNDRLTAAVENHLIIIDKLVLALGLLLPFLIVKFLLLALCSSASSDLISIFVITLVLLLL